MSPLQKLNELLNSRYFKGGIPPREPMAETFYINLDSMPSQDPDLYKDVLVDLNITTVEDWLKWGHDKMVLEFLEMVEKYYENEFINYPSLREKLKRLKMVNSNE